MVFPVILIIIGVSYLLANLGLISMTPWQVVVQYWPVIVIYMGLRMLIKNYIKNQQRKFSELFIALIIIFLGVQFLLPRIGYEQLNVSWGIIWPVIIITIGLAGILNPKTRLVKTSKGRVFVHGDYQKSTQNNTVVGEVRRGGESWYVEDTSVKHGVGEIHYDLTRAVIPDKEVYFHIVSGIGEVTIYVPKDLPIQVYCNVKVGNISIADHATNGISRTLEFISPNYHETERKLKLYVSLGIGDITVRQIG